MTSEIGKNLVTLSMKKELLYLANGGGSYHQCLSGFTTYYQLSFT